MSTLTSPPSASSSLPYLDVTQEKPAMLTWLQTVSQLAQPSTAGHRFPPVCTVCQAVAACVGEAAGKSGVLEGPMPATYGGGRQH